MAKSRKNCKHLVTNRGLQKWYESEFEKLGWMVLSKQYGMHDKVNLYIKSLHYLHDHLSCKLQAVMEKDRQDDLRIMMDNVSHLIQTVKRI
jgi:hypothetical protein